MTQQERLEIAKKLREADVETNMAPELFEKYPVKESKELQVETRVGKTHIFLHFPLCGQKPYPLFVNIHGGGFIKGHKVRDTLFCRKIAHTLNCAVIDIDYVPAPEERFPYSLHECYDVVKWAYENAEELGIDRKRIAVGGHSAGGTLTAGLAMMANKTRDFSVVLLVLDYPPMDIHTDPALKESPENSISIERARLYNDLYADEEERKNPLVSPVYASQDMLEGLPPVLIITAGLDSLCREAEQYAKMLVDAGVPVTIRRFHGSEHGFVVMRKAGCEEAGKMIIGSLEAAFRIEDT